MGFNWDTTDLENSAFIKGSHLDTGATELCNYVNTGLGLNELSPARPLSETTTDSPDHNFEGWCTADKFFKPEFFGSPSPRMNGITSQIHHRSKNLDWSKGFIFDASIGGKGISPVPSLNTRIKLPHNAYVTVMASFYAFEFGGLVNHKGTFGIDLTDDVDLDEKELRRNYGYESAWCANFDLHVNGTRQYGTTRSINVSNVVPYWFDKYDSQAANGFLRFPMIGRRQISMIHADHFSAGIHDLGVRLAAGCVDEKYHWPLQMYLTSDSYTENAHGIDTGFIIPKVARKAKFIFVLARNFVVDCVYSSSRLPDNTFQHLDTRRAELEATSAITFTSGSPINVNYDSSKNELAGTLSAYATAIDGDGLALETPIQNTVDKNATPQLRYSVLGSNEKKLTAGLKAVAPDLSQTSNTYKKNTNNKNNSGY